MLSNCPYCNGIGKQAYAHTNCLFRCENHGDIIVDWFVEEEEVVQIELRFEQYFLRIDNNTTMFLYIDNFPPAINLPFDKNITPENLPKKIKTYLIFQ